MVDLHDAQRRREQQQARAFEIADEAMFDALESYGAPQDESGTVFELMGEFGTGVVHKLAEACPELREAIDWLRGREFVQLASDEQGEHVVVLRRPGE